jgi:branched-chain amino acid transport system substrate-binding protein
MGAIVSAIRAQNGELEPRRTQELLTNWSNPDSPRGPMRIDPETRDVIHNIYVRRVQKVDGELRNVEFVTIPSVKDPWKALHPEEPGGASSGGR